MNKSELQVKFENEIKPELKKLLGIENDMAVPTLEKIVVNAGIGSEYRSNSSVVEEMSEIIATITGQKPVVTKAKKAIANFKIRAGMPNGVKVTLRKDRMWDFYYKLVNIVFPRVKDFRGVSDKSFDGRGNYTVGIVEHTVFPEIDINKLQKIRSLQIVINTTADNDEHAKILLEKLGMPFRKTK
ncbi:MAG: 50S ribosomal protein L5 [Candidatus Dojkabacteria bacterium]|nr:MAG: 50S ribosomal protein L5 [Candidatus Dojkabacteria bacterium]